MSSTDSLFAHRFLGVRSTAEILFEEHEGLSPDFFTSSRLDDQKYGRGESEEPPIRPNALMIGATQDVAEVLPESKAPSDVPNKKRRASWGAVAAIAAVLGLLVYLWQGESGSRQAKSAEATYAIEGGALFRSEKLPSDQSPAALKGELIENYLPFDRRFQNVGRSPATNVHIRCGGKKDHGLFGSLGTIPAGSSYEVHSHLFREGSDVLHINDSECFSSVFLFYDDAAGHHAVTFDSAGNAINEPSEQE